MTSLEAIGNTQQSASLRSEETPVVRTQEPGGEKPVDRGERAEAGSAAHRVELPARSFQARLNYDNDADEVVVEILNPQTGDVLTRLPAEELPDDIRAFVGRSGPLVETFA